MKGRSCQNFKIRYSLRPEISGIAQKNCSKRPFYRRLALDKRTPDSKLGDSTLVALIRGNTTMNRQTYLAKNDEVKQDWYHVDATDLVMGRLSAKLATILMGKQ